MSNCADFQELYELYALGVLDETEKEGIDEHLATGCATCRASIAKALVQNAMISGTVPLVQPSAHLRNRVMASYGEPQKERSWFWSFVAVAAVLAVGVLTLFVQNRELRTEIAESGSHNAATLARIAAASEVLQAPSTRLVTFGPGAAPHGSVFVNSKLGIVMVAGTLGVAPAGWNYETWIIPASGVPKAVEPFQPDANGSAITIIPGSVNVDSVKAVAVSLEPPGATLEKPTKVLFAAKL